MPKSSKDTVAGHALGRLAVGRIVIAMGDHRPCRRHGQSQGNRPQAQNHLITFLEEIGSSAVDPQRLISRSSTWQPCLSAPDVVKPMQGEGRVSPKMVSERKARDHRIPDGIGFTTDCRRRLPGAKRTGSLCSRSDARSIHGNAVHQPELRPASRNAAAVQVLQPRKALK